MGRSISLRCEAQLSIRDMLRHAPRHGEEAREAARVRYTFKSYLLEMSSRLAQFVPMAVRNLSINDSWALAMIYRRECRP
jgi:hypothetical protein